MLRSGSRPFDCALSLKDSLHLTAEPPCTDCSAFDCPAHEHKRLRANNQHRPRRTPYVHAFCRCFGPDPSRRGSARYACVSFQHQACSAFPSPIFPEAGGPVILSLLGVVVVPDFPFLGVVDLEPLVLFPLLDFSLRRFWRRGLRFWRRWLRCRRGPGILPRTLWVAPCSRRGNMHTSAWVSGIEILNELRVYRMGVVLQEKHQAIAKQYVSE